MRVCMPNVYLNDRIGHIEREDGSSIVIIRSRDDFLSVVLKCDVRNMKHFGVNGSSDFIISPPKLRSASAIHHADIVSRDTTKFSPHT